LKPAFTPAVIDQLRQRVIAHNSALNGVPRDTYGVKLGKLKGLFRQFHSGKGNEHALAKIDQHLDDLRRDALGLAKAQPPRGHRPFDDARHPRGQAGQFTHSGSGHQYVHTGRGNQVIDGGGGQGRFFHDVASPQAHRDLQDANSGYDAFQTQVIPETRYSTLMPPIAGAAGVALGGIAGSAAKFGGTRFDRAVTRVAGRVGAGVGHYAGGILVDAPLTTERAIRRAVIARANKTLGTKFKRPPPMTGQIRGAAGGEKVGRAVGHGIGRTTSFISNAPPAAAKWIVSHGTTSHPIPRRVVGGITGAALTGGLVYGPALYHAAGGVGPYLDTLFPRRVRKSVGTLFDDPDVLAKQAELLGDELAKANVGRLAATFLRTGRRLITRVPRPPAAAVPRPAAGIGPDAARNAFTHPTNPVFTVRPHRASRAIKVGQYAIPIAAAGSGIGAIGGAAAGYGKQKWDEWRHPRGQHGRFVHRGAVFGAKVGAVVGAGLGVGVGIVAAQRGHTHLLNAALDRLGAAAADMHTSATTGARNVHAADYVAKNRRSANLRELKVPPGSTVSHEQVKTHIEAEAVRRWNQAEGAAIAGGPKAWYAYQTENVFDAEVRRQMSRLAPTLPTRSGGTVSAKNGGNFFESVDPRKLTPDQRRLWNDLTRRRQHTLDDVEKIYTQRAAKAEELRTDHSKLNTEREKITQDLEDVPTALNALDNNGATVGVLRDFAQRRMGLTLPRNMSRENVLQRIDEHQDVWDKAQRARLAEIGPEITKTSDALGEADKDIGRELSADDIGGIANRFHAEGGHFLTRMPDHATRQLQVADAASKPFVTEANQHAKDAEDTLRTLITAEEAGLRARLPRDIFTAVNFDKYFPRLSERARQTINDVHELSGADRETMSGIWQKIYDGAVQQKDPRVLYQSLKWLGTYGAQQATSTGAFLARNWKPITSMIGLGTAVGAIDLSQAPYVRGKKHWRTSREMGMRVVLERPNPIDKPDEAMVGIVYRDKSDRNREKFLYGKHFYSEAGASHDLPPGTDLENTVNRVRQGRGGAGGGDQRASAIPVRDAQAVTNAIATLRGQNHIQQVNPPGGRPFAERTGGSNQNEKDVADGFFNERTYGLGWISAQAHLRGQSTNRPDNYFRGLQQLFDAPNTAILSRAARVGLLVGDGPHNHARGLFANRGDVYTANPGAADKAAVTAELIRQVQIPVLKPRNADDYHQLLRAVWVVGEHYGLSSDQHRQIKTALDNVNSHRSGAQQGGQQQGNQQQSGAGPTREQIAHAISNIVQTAPPEERQTNRDTQEIWTDDQVHETLTSLYPGRLRQLRRRFPNDSEAELHNKVLGELQAYVDRDIRKQEPFEGLRKYLTREQGISGSGNLRPQILPPNSPQNSPMRQFAGAKPPGGSFGGDLRAATRPKQVLTQLGSYGLGQAGAEGAYHLAQHFLPGSGAMPAIARYGAGVIGGLGGGAGGYFGGRKLGGALGDNSRPRTQPPNEAMARAGAGVGGQILGTKFAPQIAGAASRLVPGAVKAGIGDIAGSAARGIGRVATAGLGEKIGGKVGGWLGGAAGTAAEPGGGTAAGWIAGTAIGTGVGWLADEGVGLLYRHLSRYGSHVPHVAAHALGVPPAKRHAAANGYG
jgi:hypothetical protein